MKTIHLLFGRGMAALSALPSLMARTLGETFPRRTLPLPRNQNKGREHRLPDASDSFDLTGARLLGREGCPFAFSSLTQARQYARRHLNDYGIVACDGTYFLADRHMADREMARTHIRSTYALTPGAIGLPVQHMDSRPKKSAPRTTTPTERLLETRQAMRNATSLDRRLSRRDALGSDDRMEIA